MGTEMARQIVGKLPGQTCVYIYKYRIWSISDFIFLLLYCCISFIQAGLAQILSCMYKVLKN